jgi:hypothetical protein
VVRIGEAVGWDPVWRKETGLVSLGAWKIRTVNRDSVWLRRSGRSAVSDPGSEVFFLRSMAGGGRV